MNVRRIFFVGYRGSGKTTVGRLLAAKLRWEFVDADILLEERAGQTIREIFANEGEPAFRDRESQVLQDIARRDRVVVSTGGGVILRPANCELLRTGLVVWLNAPPELLWQRQQADATTLDRRPNLAQGGLSEVRALLSAREPLYRACANVAIETADLAPEQIADQIRTSLTPE